MTIVAALWIDILLMQKFTVSVRRLSVRSAYLLKLDSSENSTVSYRSSAKIFKFGLNLVDLSSYLNPTYLLPHQSTKLSPVVPSGSQHWRRGWDVCNYLAWWRILTPFEVRPPTAERWNLCSKQMTKIGSTGHRPELSNTKHTNPLRFNPTDTAFFQGYNSLFQGLPAAFFKAYLQPFSRLPTAFLKAHTSSTLHTGKTDALQNRREMLPGPVIQNKSRLPWRIRQLHYPHVPRDKPDVPHRPRRSPDQDKRRRPTHLSAVGNLYRITSSTAGDRKLPSSLSASHGENSRSPRRRPHPRRTTTAPRPEEHLWIKTSLGRSSDVEDVKTFPHGATQPTFPGSTIRSTSHEGKIIRPTFHGGDTCVENRSETLLIRWTANRRKHYPTPSISTSSPPTRDLSPTDFRKGKCRTLENQATTPCTGQELGASELTQATIYGALPADRTLLRISGPDSSRP